MRYQIYSGSEEADDFMKSTIRRSSCAMPVFRLWRLFSSAHDQRNKNQGVKTDHISQSQQRQPFRIQSLITKKLHILYIPVTTAVREYFSIQARIRGQEGDKKKIRFDN